MELSLMNKKKRSILHSVALPRSPRGALVPRHLLPSLASKRFHAASTRMF